MKKQIPNSSNSFLFHKSYIHSKIPTDYPQNPWGFITVPTPIPYPYPWESPRESPYPRQPCCNLIKKVTVRWNASSSSVHDSVPHLLWDLTPFRRGRMKVNERRTVVGVDWPLCPPNRGERSTRMKSMPMGHMSFKSPDFWQLLKVLSKLWARS